ncbi:unnamed protein product, partial [Rotaria sp. Silwood1]
EGGANAVLKKKQELDDQLREVPVCIAVIGQTGSGKSTLICRLLGLLPDDPAEPTIGGGVEDNTKDAKEYPKLDTGLVYIDLPSVGSTAATCAFSRDHDKKTL